MSEMDTSAEATAQVVYQLRYLPGTSLADPQTREDFAKHVAALAAERDALRAEVAAREAVAFEKGAKAMREICSIEHGNHAEGYARINADKDASHHLAWANRLRRLPLPTAPSPDALARVRAEAQEPARRYLINAIIKPLHPDLEPLPDLIDACTQVDNIIVGVRAEAMREGMEAARDMIAHRPDAYYELDARIRAAAQEIKP